MCRPPDLQKTWRAPGSPWDGRGGGNPLLIPLKYARHSVGSDVLDEIVVDEDWSRKTTRAETLHLQNGEPAIGAGCAELLAAGLLQQRLHHVLRSADVARSRGADLNEVPAHRVGVVHGVERHHALHVCRGEPQHLSDLTNSRLGNPAPCLLNDPKSGKETCLFGGIEGEELLQLRELLAPEHRLVRRSLGPMPTVCRSMLGHSTMGTDLSG